MVKVRKGQGTKWFLPEYELGGTKWLGYEMTIIPSSRPQLN